MTRPVKKNKERHYLEEAAKRLGLPWVIGLDRECPDFIVTEGTHQFGIEVSEIFMGATGANGSQMKRAESGVQRKLNTLRAEFEAAANIPLTVKFVGNMSEPNTTFVRDRLLAEDFASKPIAYRTVIDTHNGLRVHVTKALRPDWYSVNDRVGWVDRNPLPQIIDAVSKKSGELARYIEAAGPDVRLLLFADCIYNSGKLRLEEPFEIDLCGFSRVYFFSYPETVTVFGDIAAAA